MDVGIEGKFPIRLQRNPKFKPNKIKLEQADTIQ